MSKAIKFNLICDDKPVRSIEDLQDNFSIEDVWEYYQNGLLLRWLKVRGYEKEYKKVSQIKEREKLEIIKELINIFDIESNEKKVEQGVYILQFQKERKKLLEIYKQYDFNTKNIICDYQNGYQHLVDDIISNPNNIALIKANIAKMATNYGWAFKLNHREFFWKLRESDSVLAIMCLLMNDETRKYFLPLDVKKEDDSNYNALDIADNPDKRHMYEEICRMVKSDKFVLQLGDNLYIFAGITDGYWKDLETKDKKYLIISMGNGDFVRGTGIQGGDLSYYDVENKFVIVDGIDYKSNSATRQLLYMEV